jgi:hypothetical protein
MPWQLVAIWSGVVGGLLGAAEMIPFDGDEPTHFQRQLRHVWAANWCFVAAGWWLIGYGPMHAIWWSAGWGAGGFSILSFTFGIQVFHLKHQARAWSLAIAIGGLTIIAAWEWLTKSGRV